MYQIQVVRGHNGMTPSSSTLIHLAVYCRMPQSPLLREPDAICRRIATFNLAIGIGPGKIPHQTTSSSLPESCPSSAWSCRLSSLHLVDVQCKVWLGEAIALPTSYWARGESHKSKSKLSAARPACCLGPQPAFAKCKVCHTQHDIRNGRIGMERAEQDISWRRGEMPAFATSFSVKSPTHASSSVSAGMSQSDSLNTHMSELGALRTPRITPSVLSARQGSYQLG
ncbi:hypothetical protein B0T19DRAFT_121241 [Cercophora scortea]|uniref:Uncharacterized protein n=1 Tax=Cercophora scortea TaxID=314031 RepID=A0AAE0IXT2_9PEZI|nr:hypothetical protein B0T19DRAFT_121241 [Cercophora scortea]